MAFPLQIHHKILSTSAQEEKKPTVFAVIISLTQLVMICFHVYYQTMRWVLNLKYLIRARPHTPMYNTDAFI